MPCSRWDRSRWPKTYIISGECFFSLYAFSSYLVQHTNAFDLLISMRDNIAWMLLAFPWEDVVQTGSIHSLSTLNTGPHSFRAVWSQTVGPINFLQYAFWSNMGYILFTAPSGQLRFQLLMYIYLQRLDNDCWLISFESSDLRMQGQ